MKILNKYVLREHLGPLTFALTALTSLLLLNYVAKQFGNLVGKGLAWSVIGEFFLLSIPFTVAMTLPMAVLVSVLYAFSRLASENEITALKASGVGMKRMLVPVLLGAAVLAMVMIGFNDEVLPRANHRLRVLQGDIARKKPTFALREQVINEVSPGKLFLKAGRIDENSNIMREVTIYDLSQAVRRRTIYADSGNLALTPSGGDLELMLFDGEMQEVSKADPGQLQRLFYTQDRILVKGVGNSFNRDSTDNYKSDREMSVCEMQRTVSDAERELRVAQHELRSTLVAATRTLATGVPARPTRAPEGRPSLSIGRGYCALLASVGLGGAAADSAVAPLRTAGSDRGGSAGRGQLTAAERRRRVAALPPAERPRPVPVTVENRMGGAPQPLVKGRAQRRLDSTTAFAAARAAALRDEQSDSALAALAVTNAPPTRPGAGADARAEVPAELPPLPEVVAAQVASTLDATRARVEDSRRTQDTYDVEIQKKFALSVACVVFVLLGAPIALRFPRGGVGLTIGVSLTVFALYYIGLIAGEELANRGILPPFWAMWAANVLFTIVGLFLLARMGKEGSTARGGDLSELLEALKGFVARQARRLGLPVGRQVAAEQGAD